MDDMKQNPSHSPPINKTHHQSPPSRSRKTEVSSDVKMRIKLKIPKIKDGFENDDQISNSQEQVDDDQTKVCDVRYKRISSGKALGGHSRVHSQIKNRELSLKNLKSNNDSKNTVIKPSCPICEKNFPSMKSMFGHMRCHRKIQPPAPENPSSSSSVTNPVLQKSNYQICDSHEPKSELRVIDLTESLKGWSKTARRGRKSLNGVVSISGKEDKNLREAAENMMRIAIGNSFDSDITHNNVVDESEATISNSMIKNPQIEEKYWVVLESKNRKIEENPLGSRMDYPVGKKLRIDEKVSINGGTSSVTPKTMDKGKGKAVLETGFSQEKPNDKSECDPDDKSDSRNSNESVRSERLVTMVKNKKKRRKKMKLMDLESNIHGNKHICTTCNKSFPSFQALGGHRSSHNKSRNFQIVPEDHEQHSDNTNSIEQFDEVQEVEPNVHQCKICSKTFPSGHALGGHQRCHRSGPPRVEPPSSQVTSPGEASQTGRKGLDIDLNEPASMDEEEEGIDQSHQHEVGFGYGYGFPSFF